ncbi:hypothetical protein HKD37_15G043428 [Glycine soja]
MAPKKLSTKRSRRDAVAEGSSATPEFDSHCFRSAEHLQRFEAIKGWSFHRERRVQLMEDEYKDFQEEIARRHWTSLVTPMAKFDPEIVLEFYANVWPTEEGVRDMRLWRRNRADGFDEEAIAQLLCTPGQDFARTAAGRQVRIRRTSMTTLTQTWMTLLLSNVLPSDHNSDLPLPKCQLVYALLTRMSVHMAQVIADAIYLFAGMPPTRHPLDPDKSNRALGFPALITGLCQSFGAPVTPSKVIRPPITRAFIEKYCTPRQAQGDAHQAADAPPPPHQADPAGSLGIEQQFGAEVAWPGDWPEAQAGEEPAGSPDEAEQARMDEEMTNLLGLSSSLRICRSKSLAFVGRPTISVILTLRSCDMWRQIMVIPHTFLPSRDDRVRWHAATNYGHSAPFRHPKTIVSDATQRQIMVILRLLSSKVGEPDDMRRQIMVIPHTFLPSRGGEPDDM